MRRLGRAIGVVLLATNIDTTAAAQQQPIIPPGEMTAAPGGWSVTPGIALGSTWDNNVLFRGQGSDIQSDVLTLVNPRGTVDYSNRRTRFSLGYNGTFSVYRDLTDLNSFDQVLTVGALHDATPRLSFNVQGSVTDVPTTELFPLVGVPFVRVGTRYSEVHGGFDLRMARRTSLNGSYHLVAVDFDENPIFPEALIGGWGHGGNVALRHEISERWSLTTEYDLQQSWPQARGTFVVHTAWGGFEHRLSHTTRLAGAAGIARLNGTGLFESQTGPALRASLAQSFRRAVVDVSYINSFVPSLGIGGTQENEELQARLDVTLSRKGSLNATVAWRRNEPVDPTYLKLTSIWIQGGYAYAFRPWMRLEAFYGGSHQRIDQPGGLADRHRAGVQMVTGLPLRIR